MSSDAKGTHATLPANVFLLIQQIYMMSKDQTDMSILAFYEQQGLLDQHYQAALDTWQGDANALPQAGKLDPTDPTASMNAGGMATGMTLIATGMGLLYAAKVCYVAGAATAEIGGGFLIAVAATLTAVALTLIGLGISMLANAPCWKNTALTDTIPGHDNWDVGEQNKQNSLVQQDQARVQQLQNYMNKIMQQYISPANDMKTQDANMMQAAIQWLKAMLWTQSAA